MKKFRLILALLTIVSGIYMIYANVSVSGYRLLTMNSAAGHRVAVSYRWSVVVFLVLVILNALAVFIEKKHKHKPMTCTDCGSVHGEKDKFCKKCGYSFQKR